MSVQELLSAAQELSLADQIQLASQIMQAVVKKIRQPTVSLQPESPVSGDPIIGLFSGSSDLATRSEDILAQEINSASGYSWKES